MTNEEGTGTENLFLWIKNVVAPTEIRTHITLLVYFSYFSKDMRNIQGSNRAIFFQAQKLWFFYLQNFSYDKCWDFLFVSSVVFFVISCVFVGLRWQQRLPRAYFCLLRATPQLKLVKTSTATQTVFSAIQCIIRPASLAFFPCAALLDVFTTDFLHKHQFKACLAIIKNP